MGVNLVDSLQPTASTLQFTGVTYPSTYVMSSAGFSLSGGTLSSNVPLKSITSMIVGADGSVPSLACTRSISGYDYSIRSLDTMDGTQNGVRFSLIKNPGTYYWYLTGEDTNGRTLELKMQFTAVSSGSTVTSTASNTYEVRPTGVSLDSSSMDLQVGEVRSLNATVSPSDAWDQSLSWTTSNSAIATYGDGIVTAVGRGTATIVCTTNTGGYTASCVVTVTQPVTGITINPWQFNLNLGESMVVTPVISPSNASNPAVVWSSENPSVATVSADGTVYAVGGGTARINCTSAENSDIHDYCMITVNAMPQSIELDETDMWLSSYNGETHTLIPTFHPNGVSDQRVTWTSSNNYVAKVSAGGVVTPVGPGLAQISCTSVADPSVTAMCEVTVWDDEPKKAMYMPGSLKKIETGAFKGDKSLLRVMIGGKVKQIGASAFENCTNLSYAFIGESVEFIDASAFKNCPKLAIGCLCGSYAEWYAKKYEIDYILLD